MAASRPAPGAVDEFNAARADTRPMRAFLRHVLASVTVRSLLGGEHRHRWQPQRVELEVRPEYKN